MGATSQDVDDLERLAHRIREETYGCGAWDRYGVHVVFHEYLTGMHLATAVELVVKHSSDAAAKTPGAIKRKFLPEVPKEVDRAHLPPRDRVYCSVHRDNPPPPYCPACATEHVWTETDPPDGLAPLPSNVHPADAVRIAAGLSPRHQEQP